MIGGLDLPKVAGPGLGLAIARRFGREGYPVALFSRRPHRHDGYLASLRDDGVTAIALTADITRPEQLHAAVTTTTERLGPAAAGYDEDQRWTLARVVALIATVFHRGTSRSAIMCREERVAVWTPGIFDGSYVVTSC